MNRTSSEMVNTPSAWRSAVLEHLEKDGQEVCQHAAQYIREHNVEIGFAKQNTGARWMLNGNIELSSGKFPSQLGTSPTNVSMLGLVVHEAKHLEQGMSLALSVEGEVGGWTAQYEAHKELGRPIAGKYADNWKAIASIPDDCETRDLRLARCQMLYMEGYGYLIWLLPLRPNFLTRLAERLQKIVFRSAFENRD